jgi:hypothetical protein
MADKNGIVIELNKRQAESVRRSFDVMKSQTETGLKRVIAEGVLSIHNDTINNPTFPVVTGALRASYMTEVQDMTGAVYTELDYGPAVEFGINQRPQPFLIPAFKKNIPRINAAIDKVIEKQL